MRLLYTIGLHIYFSLLKVFALGSPRAARWLAGRERRSDALDSLSANKKTIWIHAASAGEFEQAIPLLDRIRAANPEFQVAVSFYSPSGYDLYRDSGLADVFFYFPPDLPNNVRILLQKLRPELAIFVRNETWWNTLKQLKDQYVPAILINAERDRGRGPYRLLLDRCLPLFTRIYYTDTDGSTKGERVLDIARTDFRDPVLESFTQNSFTLLLGSCYDTEVRMAAGVYNKLKDRYPALKIACCPHTWDDTTKGNYESIFREKIGAYSREETQGRLLFIDRMGILKYIYRYADSAFIGGGFSKGIHNVSEAEVYGIPVAIGPNYKNFSETTELVRQGHAVVIHGEADLENWLRSILEKGETDRKRTRNPHAESSAKTGVSEKIWSDAVTLIRR